MFVPGKSGNPKGRPRRKDSASVIRKLILHSAPDWVAKMIDAANTGDIPAGRALLATVMPTLKPIELPVLLPGIAPDAGLADQGRAVIAALAKGQLAPGQASQILAALAGIARLVELDELESRITNLENKS